jgi:hypothetical protein
LQSVFSGHLSPVVNRYAIPKIQYQLLRLVHPSFYYRNLYRKFTHDAFIRPFVGDFLVVILLYCLVKSFTRTAVYPTAIAVFLFSWFVEWMQYFHWVDRLGLDHSYFARMLLGNYFSWVDLLMYTLGILLVIVVER